MRVRCTKCWKQFSDTRQSTICPHDEFMTADHEKTKSLAVFLVGKKVHFNHQEADQALHVQSANALGMVSVREYPGWFAPHLFRVIE